MKKEMQRLEKTCEMQEVKEELIGALKLYSINSKEILSLSEQLDELILSYYKKYA